MQSIRNLDFLIIGAQKAGTTTLFKLLSGHPALYMPAAKEVPFFTMDDRYNAGLKNYMEEFFPDNLQNRLLGTATPHYLADPRVPARIEKLLPQVKLVAILRHPIDRAISHYRMTSRRGLESRSFKQAATELMAPDMASRNRDLLANLENEPHCYLAWSEYGRLISGYLNHFRREQLLVVFTDELSRTPGKVLDRILRFLDLPEHYQPANLNKRYHEGGFREKFPQARNLVRLPVIRAIWHSIPGQIRRPLSYWFHQFNVVKEPVDSGFLPRDLEIALIEFFRGDVKLLETVTGRPVPWDDFR